LAGLPPQHVFVAAKAVQRERWQSSQAQENVPDILCSIEIRLASCAGQQQLHGAFRIIVGNNRGFEGLIILGVLERGNDGLAGEGMADGNAARVGSTSFFFLPYSCRQDAN
jgi:hypothetical protein